MNLPDFAMQKLTLISQKTGIEVEELMKAYEKVYNDPWVQSDPQFTSDELRHTYVSTLLWARYITKPPMKEYEVVPIGFGPVRTTKSGPQATMFALVRTGREIKLTRIVLRENLDVLKTITPCCKYKVKLGSFSSGDLIADSRTLWENPEVTGINIQEFLQRMGVKRVPIKDAANNLSRVGPDGFVDEKDWRMVRGIISTVGKGKREDGTEWAYMVLVDETTGDVKLTSDGRVLRPGLTVWVAPELLSYPKESMVDAIGTLQLGKKTNEPFMNAYLVLPVILKKEEG